MKTNETQKTVETTITIETPKAADVQVQTEAKPAPKAKGKTTGKKDAKPKAKPETKKPESKKSESKPKAESKPDVSKIQPLKVDKKLLDSKLEKLNEKLSKEKRETTKSPFHVAYGYFLAKTRAGKVLALEYHESLKSDKWLLRDLQSKKVLTEPMKTMHGLHEKAVREF